MTQKGTQILEMLPQIEEPELTKVQEKIYSFLLKRKRATLPKTIAENLNMPFGSVRGGLSILQKKGLVCRGVKSLRMGDLDVSGRPITQVTNQASYIIKG